MDSQVAEGDRLFLIAENLAQDFSLFPDPDAAAIEDNVRGLLPRAEIAQQVKVLGNMDTDAYIESVVARAEDPARVDAPSVVRQLGRVSKETVNGPFYAAHLEMDFNGSTRVVAFIAQDRSVKNGVWMPEHHLAAAEIISECSKRAIPIVSLMDTPGADAEEVANKNNQAHSISRLIAEMCNVDVPNLGVIFGLGYSGGAIPLAASNLILSVRDGVFSTIQPKGLANIARRLGLSWQECAKQVGCSPFELYMQGNIDGIIDYSPGEEGEALENFRMAIVTGIESVERGVSEFVLENPYIMDHYRHNLERYLRPSERLQSFEATASLRLTKSPTEYSNVFGVAYRYLRYLSTRKRIKATTTKQYGRLAAQELPKGELEQRAVREQRQTFLKWIQDPEKIVYDDALAKAWRNYNEKKQAVHDERGRVARLLFGEPRKNYEDARDQLLASVGMYLYNRWKSEAQGNFEALVSYLGNPNEARNLLRVDEISDPVALIDAIGGNGQFGVLFQERFTYEGKKLLAKGGVKEKTGSYLRSRLTTELNLVMSDGALFDGEPTGGAADTSIAANRQLLDQAFSRYFLARSTSGPVPFSDMTLLDVLLDEDLRGDFIAECNNLLLFDAFYDQVIASLDFIAEEAESTRALSESSMTEMLDRALFKARGLGAEHGEQKAMFFDWFLRIAEMPRSNDFFRAVEEWKKSSFPELSDTLFVVVTHLFERLLVSYLNAERHKRRYEGRISPRNIGRRKDFWNRLTIAYRDLRIQQVLDAF